MTDLNGYIFVKVRYYRLIIYSCLCTLFMQIALFFRGVKYGRNVRFYELPVIIRMVQSRITIGSGCTFRSDFASNLVGINRKCIVTTLRKNSEVLIGDNSGFSGTVIAAAGSIKIGNSVLCGANTTITDYDWHGLDPDERFSPAEPKPIVIEDNVWLGLNSLVLKGVTIGKNSVIGANSVVTKDIPANVIAAGNPCKVIKELKIDQKENAI